MIFFFFLVLVQVFITLQPYIFYYKIDKMASNKAVILKICQIFFIFIVSPKHRLPFWKDYNANPTPNRRGDSRIVRLSLKNHFFHNVCHRQTIHGASATIHETVGFNSRTQRVQFTQKTAWKIQAVLRRFSC